MKSRSAYCLIFLASLALLFSACTKRLADPPDPKFEPEQIKFWITADECLNKYNGRCHTLYVCIYQLRDPNSFNRMAEIQEGLYELLGEGCRFNDPSVAFAKGTQIRPNQKDFAITLDRAEGAKYIGIVAGYSSLQKEGTVRLFDIPIIEQKRKEGWFRKVLYKAYGPITIDLVLGETQIRKAVAK
jgi:type VI secretion system VasD/TssJ family lipoprotein